MGHGDQPLDVEPEILFQSDSKFQITVDGGTAIFKILVEGHAEYENIFNRSALSDSIIASEIADQVKAHVLAYLETYPNA